MDSHEIVNTSGAGDCFTGGFVWSLMQSIDTQESLRTDLNLHIENGIRGSRSSLRCQETVPPSLSFL